MNPRIQPSELHYLNYILNYKHDELNQNNIMELNIINMYQENYHKLLERGSFTVIPKKEDECRELLKHYDYDEDKFVNPLNSILYKWSNYYRAITGAGGIGCIGHMAELQYVQRYIKKIFLIENGESLNLNSRWSGEIESR